MENFIFCAVMTTLVDLLIGDSTLLLYFTEFRAKSQISTKEPILYTCIKNVFYIISIFTLSYLSKPLLASTKYR